MLMATTMIHLHMPPQASGHDAGPLDKSCLVSRGTATVSSSADARRCKRAHPSSALILEPCKFTVKLRSIPIGSGSAS